MNSIRIGIIGAGRNTRAMHIPHLQAIEGVEIVAVANRSLASAEKVAQEFQIPRAYAHWEELLQDSTLDAVVIGTWPYMHSRLSIAALEAGKHVLCEARMAMNLGEGLAMRDAAQAHPRLVSQLVPAPHTLGVDATAQRLLAEGYLGQPLVVRIRDGNSFIDPQSALHWRQDADLSGHNILSMGIWYEILLRWLGEARSVQAMGKIFTKTRRDDEGNLRAVRVPEHVDILADLACGAQAHLQFSSVIGLAGPAELVIYGSEGTLRYSDGKLYGAQRGDDTLRELPIPDAEHGGWRVEAEFIGAIRGTEAVKLTTFETGVKYMQFTDAVAESMAIGSAVKLALSL